MSGNTRFLQSSLTTNDLATESTLKNIQNTLITGIPIESIEPILVKTDTGDLVDVSINTANQTGDLRCDLQKIKGSDTAVNSGDKDDGTQRVIIANDNPVYHSGGDIYVSETTKGVLVMGRDYSLEEMRAIKTSTTGRIEVDQCCLKGIAISNWDGDVDGGTQRVIIANDNPVYYKGGGVYSGGTSKGVLQMGVVGAVTTPIKVNSIGRTQTDLCSIRDELISVNSGDIDNGTQRVTLANDNILRTLNNIKFRSHFDTDTQTDKWDYTLVSGAGISEAHNAVQKRVDITTTLNTTGLFRMTSQESFNCLGTHNRLIITFLTTLSDSNGNSILDYIKIGMHDNANAFGMNLQLFGDDQKQINFNNGGYSQSVTSTSWNKNTTILGNLDEPTTLIFDFNTESFSIGQIYNGVYRNFHTVNNHDSPNNYPLFQQFPVLIDIKARNPTPSFVFSISSVKLIQEYPPINATNIGNSDENTQRVVLATDQTSVPVTFGINTSKSFVNVMLQNGGINATGEYSEAQTDFTWTNSTGNDVYITRMLVYIEDNQVHAVNKYGNMSALGVGVKTFIDDGGKVYLHPDLPVKSNGDWNALCFDAVYFDYGPDNEGLAVRWTFSKAISEGLLVPNGADFGVQLEDDFDGLVKHYFTIQGYNTGS